MKYSNVLIVALLVLLSSMSCTKLETEFCTCTTTVLDPNGEILSVEGSAEEVPPDGKCSSLFSSVTDPDTGYNTLTR